MATAELPSAPQEKRLDEQRAKHCCCDHRFCHSVPFILGLFPSLSNTTSVARVKLAWREASRDWRAPHCIPRSGREKASIKSNQLGRSSDTSHTTMSSRLCCSPATGPRVMQNSGGQSILWAQPLALQNRTQLLGKGALYQGDGTPGQCI